MTEGSYAALMTTATRSVAVVATRLPITDRRALSQAWFSALHLTQPAARGAAAPHSPQSSSARATPARRAADVAQRVAGRSAALRAASTAGRLSAVNFAVERRGPSCELARRIETAVARQRGTRPHQTAAIAISVGEGRVQLLVRNDGTTTRIIALCAPHLRERVDRALAHARFALAAAGTPVEGAQ
jgi:hypothetical protein